MSFNQKILAGICVLFVAVTLGITFVLYAPPYSLNFKIEVFFIVLSEIIAGWSLVAKFGKGDGVLSFALGSLPIDVVYVACALFMALFTGLSTKVFILLHCVALAVLASAKLVFCMGERHISTQADADPPKQKINQADVSWR